MENEKEILENEEIETKEITKDDELDKTFVKKERPHIFRTLFNIIFWLAVIILAFTWIMDYMKVKNNKEPQFCLSKTTHKFSDGTVDECLGLGYKIYSYNRTSLSGGKEFVPFFVSMKEPKK